MPFDDERVEGQAARIGRAQKGVLDLGRASSDPSGHSERRKVSSPLCRLAYPQLTLII